MRSLSMILVAALLGRLSSPTPPKPWRFSPRRPSVDPEAIGRAFGHVPARVRNEVPGSPVRQELRERRRANAARNLATGHWQLPVHIAVPC